MTPLHSGGAATLPKGFRFSRPDAADSPRTPEPPFNVGGGGRRDSGFDNDSDSIQDVDYINNEALPLLQPPAAPRPRLRLKRRNASNLRAPTQQFLASVAAADIPIPSIEEPERVEPSLSLSAVGELTDARMVIDSLPATPATVEMRDEMLLYPELAGRMFSPPKTPAPFETMGGGRGADSANSSFSSSSSNPFMMSSNPNAVPSLSPRRYPDWSVDSSSSVESTPEWESSRPSTSRSTHTTASLFSRFSVMSDGEGAGAQCVSPELESRSGAGDVLFNPAALSSRDPEDIVAAMVDGKGRVRKAPWTKAMSSHLWSTYMMYLQDPRVTPFRMGKSAVPPQGVLSRVARQAKKTWKGSKLGAAGAVIVPGQETAAAAEKATTATTTTSVVASSSAAAAALDEKKSGSSTPTAEAIAAAAAKTFMQWPHTAAATRAHLRDLCKLKASASSGMGHHRILSSSPTPYSKAASRHWNRRSTPARSPSVFSAGDMAMSLTLSTAESMQPSAPIAQLTSGMGPIAREAAAAAAAVVEEPVAPAPALETSGPESSSVGTTLPLGLDLSAMVDRPRLGSPFRSYGPSSSSSGSLAAALAQLGNGGGTANAAASFASTIAARQTLTIGPRRGLQPAARLLSRSATQKRRTRQSSNEPRKRPVLAMDIWTDPAAAASAEASADGEQQQRAAEAEEQARRDEMLTPRASVVNSTPPAAIDDIFAPNASSSQWPYAPLMPGQRPASLSTSTSMPVLAAAPGPFEPPLPPQRLGSPFSVTGGRPHSASFSFPNRFSQPLGGVGIDNMSLPARRLRRPYATIHQQQSRVLMASVAAAPMPSLEGLLSGNNGDPPVNSNATTANNTIQLQTQAQTHTTSSTRSSLQSRLAYIDQRLRELRNRDALKRRSESPL